MKRVDLSVAILKKLQYNGRCKYMIYDMNVQSMGSWATVNMAGSLIRVYSCRCGIALGSKQSIYKQLSFYLVTYNTYMQTHTHTYIYDIHDIQRNKSFWNKTVVDLVVDRVMCVAYFYIRLFFVMRSQTVFWDV